MSNPSTPLPEQGGDGITSLTKEMAHKLSQKYFQSIQRVYLENEMQDLTLREYEKRLVKAQVTAELCIDLMDSLILSRFDYIVSNAVQKKLEEKL